MKNTKKSGFALVVTMIFCLSVALLATTTFSVVYRYKMTQKNIIENDIQEIISESDGADN